MLCWLAIISPRRHSPLEEPCTLEEHDGSGVIHSRACIVNNNRSYLATVTVVTPLALITTLDYYPYGHTVPASVFVRIKSGKTFLVYLCNFIQAAPTRSSIFSFKVHDAASTNLSDTHWHKVIIRRLWCSVRSSNMSTSTCSRNKWFMRTVFLSCLRFFGFPPKRLLTCEARDREVSVFSPRTEERSWNSDSITLSYCITSYLTSPVM